MNSICGDFYCQRFQVLSGEGERENKVQVRISHSSGADILINSIQTENARNCWFTFCNLVFAFIKRSHVIFLKRSNGMKWKCFGQIENVVSDFREWYKWDSISLWSYFIVCCGQSMRYVSYLQHHPSYSLWPDSIFVWNEMNPNWHFAMSQAFQNKQKNTHAKTPW